MIVEEILTNNLVKHYSDNGKYILQNETGIEYAEAVDVLPCRYTYSETQKNIEDDNTEKLDYYFAQLED